MNLHEFITAAAEKGWLKTIDKPVSTELELAAVAYALDGSPVLFTNVQMPDAGGQKSEIRDRGTAIPNIRYPVSDSGLEERAE
ncbi:MAG TPA: hypothetical protein G4N94_10845, partial [Caldilineae bacterium]|nr:hypothetical protein [Caldilineae bacterium]